MNEYGICAPWNDYNEITNQTLLEFIIFVVEFSLNIYLMQLRYLIFSIGYQEYEFIITKL